MSKLFLLYLSVVVMSFTNLALATPEFVIEKSCDYIHTSNNNTDHRAFELYKADGDHTNWYKVIIKGESLSLFPKNEFDQASFHINNLEQSHTNALRVKNRHGLFIIKVRPSNQSVVIDFWPDYCLDWSEEPQCLKRVSFNNCKDY